MKIVNRLKNIGKEFLYFISSRQFVFGCLGIAGLVSGLLFIFFMVLGTYTLHGSSIKVSGFKGLTLTEAKKLALKGNFRLVISDSVYSKNAIPGLILDQNPKEGEKVKKGRTIYLSVNTSTAPLIPIVYNQVIGRPRSYVAAIFEKNELKIGKETAVKCKAFNTIVELKWEGKTLLKEADPTRGEKKPTTPVKVPMGTRLELCYCEGNAGDTPEVPDLDCLSYEEALAVLEAAGYVLGKVSSLDKNISDTLSCYVYKQDPLPTEKMAGGRAIDIGICIEKPAHCP